MTTADHRAMLLTPRGVGAIAVIRVAGSDPVAVVNSFFRPKNGPPLSRDKKERLRYGLLVDADEVLDDVIASVTIHDGRGVVDIGAHGGVRITERILQALETRGVRIIEPDDDPDFVWTVKDCIEREVLSAMGLAKTERALRFLGTQRDGLSRELLRIAGEIEHDSVRAVQDFGAMFDGFEPASFLLQGATVALIGPPNSGKSTLFNRMLGRSAVVVSPQAGTTRDWIAEPIELLGIPITLADTAGLHESTTALETLAIEAGRRLAEAADLRILVLDSTSRVDPLQRSATHGRPTDLVVFNKSDLDSSENLPNPTSGSEDSFRVSALTGAGLDRMACRIAEKLGISEQFEHRLAFFTARQADVAKDALSILPTSRREARRRIVEDLVGGRLRNDEDREPFSEPQAQARGRSPER